MPASTRPADADPLPAPGGAAPVAAVRTARCGPSFPSACWALSAWGAALPAATRPLSPSAGGNAECAIDDMLGLTLHDLRNSLSALHLGVELLGRREDASQQPVSAVLAHMDSAAQRAQASTIELEDLYRLAAGRPLAISPTRFSLHALVRDALDACTLIVPGMAVEHDRLGEGDCVGDPVRMAQFLALALEALCAAGPPALLIVISEVAGDRYRIALHAETAHQTAAAHAPASPPARVQARRRALLQAIAQAHGGRLRAEDGPARGRSIEADFSRPAALHASR